MALPEYFRAPILLLEELGINEPHEIDIEAIAEYCRATVVYEPLDSCAARILGYGDSALITVDIHSTRARQRFSAGHELGHWMHDRGKIAFSCDELTLDTQWSELNPEQRANRYAAELLLPEPMFLKHSLNKEITFATVRGLSGLFQTSITATAIRLVDLGSFPCVIIWNQQGRGPKFIRSPSVPECIWPHKEPGRNTIVHDLMKGKRNIEGPAELFADEWIDYPNSSRYGIIEDSLLIGKDTVLTLLWWKDEAQLVDIERAEMDS